MASCTSLFSVLCVSSCASWAKRVGSATSMPRLVSIPANLLYPHSPHTFCKRHDADSYFLRAEQEVFQLADSHLNVSQEVFHRSVECSHLRITWRVHMEPIKPTLLVFHSHVIHLQWRIRRCTLAFSCIDVSSGGTRLFSSQIQAALLCTANFAAGLFWTASCPALTGSFHACFRFLALLVFHCGPDATFGRN